MRPLRDLTWYQDGIRSGNRVALAQAITLVESELPDHRDRAHQLVGSLLDPQHKTFRVAISGAPGAGKSTLIEALGLELIQRGHKVAVLAIDPSSTVTQGSILGDKTRMEHLSAHPHAFVRPTASGGALGGVARKTRETITLVEAAGYDIVLVETVGVGQSEVAAQSLTDMFVLVLIPGAGDDLQGIKRGIVELADLCVVNKASGERLQQAKTARAHYTNALHLLAAKPHGLTVDVMLTDALEKTGISALADQLMHFEQQTRASGYLEQQRNQQQLYWWRASIQQMLQQHFSQTEGIEDLLSQQQQLIESGKITAWAAAQEAIRFYQQQISKNS